MCSHRYTEAGFPGPLALPFAFEIPGMPAHLELVTAWSPCAWALRTFLLVSLSWKAALTLLSGFVPLLGKGKTRWLS